MKWLNICAEFLCYTTKATILDKTFEDFFPFWQNLSSPQVKRNLDYYHQTVNVLVVSRVAKQLKDTMKFLGGESFYPVLVTHYSLLVTLDLLPAAFYWLLYSLLITFYLLLLTCYPLLFTGYSLHFTCYFLLVLRCYLHVTLCYLLCTRNALFVQYCIVFTMFTLNYTPVPEKKIQALMNAFFWSVDIVCYDVDFIILRLGFQIMSKIVQK